VVDRRRTGQRLASDDVGEDVVDLGCRVAELLERGREALVRDLEVTAAGELLELDEREVGFDSRRVAVHQQADRAGRRDAGDLRVAEAVLLAERQRAVPALARGFEQIARAQLRLDADRRHAEAFVFGSHRV
jgi:hypothetical protein